MRSRRTAREPLGFDGLSSHVDLAAIDAGGLGDEALDVLAVGDDRSGIRRSGAR